MTYNVSSGTLNLTLLYSTLPCSYRYIETSLQCRCDVLQFAESRIVYLCVNSLYVKCNTCTGVEVADAVKEKDGILSLQLLESKVDHSVLSDLCHVMRCLKFALFIYSVILVMLLSRRHNMPINLLWLCQLIMHRVCNIACELLM